jgi:hypothetical protein
MSNGRVTERREQMTDITDKIVDFDEDAGPLKVLVYGDPGVGKSVFAATAPKPLFIDIERGLRSLKNHPEISQYVKRFPLNTVKELEDLFWKIKEGHEAFADRETIVFDTFSALQKKRLDEQLKEGHEKDSSKNPYLATQGDYKGNTQHLRRLIVQFCELDRFHIVVITHATEVKDEFSGALLLRPALTPKLAETFEELMDVYCYMTSTPEQDGVVRRIQISPGQRVKAKNRVGGLPPIIQDPNFNMLLNGKINLPPVETDVAVPTTIGAPINV